jgi:lipopolysaccharide transport system ATP-binding protein
MVTRYRRQQRIGWRELENDLGSSEENKGFSENSMKLEAQDRVAVRAERLSKKYTITVKGAGASTLSETLSGCFQKIRGIGRQTSEEEIWSVQDISFEIKRGEVVGIIGRNGAGKSTLLKILSRITEPTSGRAEIYGRVGTLLEVGTGFHPELTGRDNVYLSGVILGMKQNEIAARFDEIVAFSGIGKFIDTPVKRYSSGMYVRLAFAVAAHLESEVLIVDEVLAVGDGDFQKRCISKMQELGKEGRTVLFVSHSLPTITRLCRRAILLDKGRLIADGPTGEVVSTYLHAGIHASGAKEWIDRDSAPGNEAVRLRAVRIRNDRMEISNIIPINKVFSVELEYEVLKPGLILAPHFGLLNERGDVLFQSYEVNVAWRDCPRKVGKYTSQGIVPGNLLTEGTYFINALCRTLQTRDVDIQERQALVFQVVESDEGDSARGNIGGHISGLIRPLLEWRTHFEELVA